MTKPIRPEEIAGVKKEQLPNEVIEAFNEEIAKHYNNGRAKVLQKDVVARIRTKMDIDADKDHHIYNDKWLDVEGIYRAEGWKVRYEKPVAWGGDNFDAYFEFERA